MKMLHISVFSGIGGFDLASEWMGWTNIVSCEINPFGQRVLKHYWPDAYHHDNIKTLTYKKINEELEKRFGNKWRNDDIILTGGFPCQPYSLAGKRKGKDDDRHLWPEMLRVIREVRPKWIVGENVFGIVNWSGGMVFEEVQADLEDEGYEVQPFILPACAKDAPHRRDRVWFVAYRNDNGLERCNGKHEVNASERGFDALNDFKQIVAADTQDIRCRIASDTRSIRIQRQPINARSSEKAGQGWEGIKEAWNYEHIGAWHDFPTQSPICVRNDGIPTELSGITFPKWRNESIKAMGNAVVPQIVYEIFKAIEKYENLVSCEKSQP